MPILYTEQYFRTLAQNKSSQLRKSIDNLITENNQIQQFDIFLSHSSMDKEVIFGISIELAEMGYSSYVYWITDHHMTTRETVDETTAANLKRRLKQCDTLFYATTKNSSTSKWMPWELGYMDGYRGKCAIFFVAKNSPQTNFQGQEYLSIYPYAMYEKGIYRNALMICDTASSCIPFHKWKGMKSLKSFINENL